jgi:hypothetical protein
MNWKSMELREVGEITESYAQLRPHPRPFVPKIREHLWTKITAI